MNLKTTFERLYTNEITQHSIPLNTKRVGVLLTCPFCHRAGKKIVIVYPMAYGKIVVFKGRKRCNVVRCSHCEHIFITSVDCLAENCSDRAKCLQKGIAILDVGHLYE